MSYVRREDVIGKKVITSDGNTFGEVRDIAFSLDGSVGLVVSAVSGSDVVVPMRQASAVGEFVLLSTSKPETTAAPVQPRPAPPAVNPVNCPACGSPVKPGARFCGKCGQKLS